MATGRGNLICSATIAVFVAGFLFVASQSGFAQEKKKISWSVKAENSKNTFRHRFAIPDMPDHGLVLQEFRRTWPDGGGPIVEGQKVIEEIVWETSDGVAGNGFAQGYSHWRFENGDQSFGAFRGAYQSVINPDGSRKVTFAGSYVTTGGSGKLKGLKGAGKYSGLAEVNAELKLTRTEYSAEGEYWFEK